MYKSLPSRHSPGRRSNMLIKNLPGPRWLLFGLASICYFIFTIYILSYNQEPCTRKHRDFQDPDHHESSDSREEVAAVAARMHAGKGMGGEYDKGSRREDTKETVRRAQMGPIGKKMEFALDGSKLGKPADVKHYDPDILDHTKLLDRKLTSNTVFMVWCGRRWFEFHHYLSVVSAIKHLRPDLMVFYYNYLPVKDFWLYNTWFDEIRDMYPFFQLHEMTADMHGCAQHSTPNITFVYSLLTAQGGMYLNEHTILSRFPLEYRLADFVYALDTSTMNGFVVAKANLPGRHKINYILGRKDWAVASVSCAGIHGYEQAKGKLVCVNVNDVFYPKDIWVLESEFANLVRTLFYNNPAPVDAKPDPSVLIPNIAHMVWIGGGRMDFLFYIGVLSLIYVAEVDVVYIHGNYPPRGHFWDRVKDHPKVKLIYREVPVQVYGQHVKVLSHVTDIWRVDFMIRYGGIYVDTDTVFVQKLDDEIRSYDAVGAYDWTYWNHPFPDTINFGVAIGKRNASYWHHFQKTMKWFIDDDWSWNGLRQPYRMKERHPELVRIDPRLQVICYQYKCHPTWHPDYHNESIHHMNSPSIKNWRKDTYAFHWTLPTPPELDDEELLMTSQTMAAEVGRYVLEKAGLLEKLRNKYLKKQQLHDPPKKQMADQKPKLNVYNKLKTTRKLDHNNER